jgi:CRISPR system Cascade subunit CasA
MADLKFNLLTEPLLRVRGRDQTVAGLSLPQILALLSEGDELADFTGLRVHQAHAWHAFLVQLAAIALRRAGCDQPPTDEHHWRDLIHDLTDGADEPFCLVVPDLSQPAFLQPPVPEGKLDKFKNELATPDELDMLVTAKNHDLKMSRIARPRPELWVYALVTLQTMEGFSGRANYGIVRMNSGFGNRPCVSRLPGFGLGARFRRDLQVLLADRSRVVTEYGYSDEGGHGLLWLVPWDGEEALPLASCDPQVIEICRRIRMVPAEDGLRTLRASTNSARLESGETKGNTGDAWTPVSLEGTGLTVPSAGFDYKRTTDLLFGGDFRPSPAQQPSTEGGEEPLFYATAMTRGQGKTEGLHQRIVPLPKAVQRRFFRRGADPSERDRLAQRAQQRIQHVADAKKKVLKPALVHLLQAGPDKADYSDERPNRWLAQLEGEVDRIFFDRLWRDADLSESEAQAVWQRELVEVAEKILLEAQLRVPLPSARRYRAWSASERVFHGSARKTFPDIFPTKGDESYDGAA